MPWIESEEIAAALRAAEARPTAEDLDGAPRIRAWSVVTYPREKNIRFEGRVRGHPIIEGTVTTSPIVALGAPRGDVDVGSDLDDADGAAWTWARTLGRWYVVDLTSFRPADPDTRDAELAAIRDVLRGYKRSMAEAFMPKVH